METTLAPSWTLSTDHASSSYGQPVLVNRHTGTAYGPGDVLQIGGLGWGPARQHAQRLGRAAQLDDDGRAMLDKFTG